MGDLLELGVQDGPVGPGVSGSPEEARDPVEPGVWEIPVQTRVTGGAAEPGEVRESVEPDVWRGLVQPGVMGD